MKGKDCKKQKQISLIACREYPVLLPFTYFTLGTLDRLTGEVCRTSTFDKCRLPELFKKCLLSVF